MHNNKQILEKILSNDGLSSTPDSLEKSIGIFNDNNNQNSSNFLRTCITWFVIIVCTLQIVFIDYIFYIICINNNYRLLDYEFYLLIGSTILEIWFLLKIVFNYLFPQSKSLGEYIRDLFSK
jgi:hypothetical protein